MFELIEQFNYRQTFATWWAALTDPWQFLVAGFHPSPEQFAAGLEFYARIFVVVMAILLMVVLACGKGSIGIKAKMLGYGLIGLVTVVLTAVTMHFSFWLLGGKANFSGTCLAYIYAAGPYQPLIAFASWIITSAMPAELRPYMLNPFTASKAGALAAKHPETDHLTAAFGTLVMTGLILWTLYLVLRALSFVQELGIFRSLLAFAIGLIMIGIVNHVLMRMSVSINEVSPQA